MVWSHWGSKKRTAQIGTIGCTLLVCCLLSTRLKTHVGEDGSTIQAWRGSASRHLLQTDEHIILAGQQWTPPVLNPNTSQSDGPCTHLDKHVGYPSACAMARARDSCSSGTYFEYIRFRYCTAKSFPFLSNLLLCFWLMLLFYMLGNTAADYFCPSLEKLSEILHLPPTVAGVTLLPLGNGAPDVFASIASFIGAGAGQVGLNSVFGAALFVTCVVAGSVSIVVARTHEDASIDGHAFARDIGFLFLATLGMLPILLVGHVELWVALCFFSIYIVYGVAVSAHEFFRRLAQKQPVGTPAWHIFQTLSLAELSLPQWMWTERVEIFAYAHHRHHPSISSEGGSVRSLWGNEDDDDQASLMSFQGLFRLLVEAPLDFPRRVTIPMIDPDRWSRKYAITSAVLAPLLVAFVLLGTSDAKSTLLFASQLLHGTPSRPGIRIVGWLLALGLSVTCGGLAYTRTLESRPPRRFLLPWVAGGFIMSVVWFYLIANELVAVLIAFGVILKMDSALLGLTVLAWGNSIGDFVANLAMASNGSEDGVQIAMSGCYAAPMFNTLVGLGSSLVLASWKTYPLSFAVPEDKSLFWTVGFLLLGLVYTAFMLPLHNMRPTRMLGVGLLGIYGSFLALRIASLMGLVSWPGL